jgi:hypothetical protein
MKARTVEQVESVIARQQHHKHVSASSYTDTTIKDAVLSMQQLQGNSTVNKQQINMQQYRNHWKWCSLCGPHKGFKSKHLSITFKLIFYKVLIQPMMVYACHTWENVGDIHS